MLGRYLGGHNDILAGSISGKAELVRTVRQLHNVLGGVLDPVPPLYCLLLSLLHKISICC